MGKSLAEFRATYDPDGSRTIADIEVKRDADGNSPFIIVHYGEFTAVLSLMPMDDHLCIDVHSFVAGADATAGAFGMSDGRRVSFPSTGTKSHGWPSANLVAVLLGAQT